MKSIIITKAKCAHSAKRSKGPRHNVRSPTKPMNGSTPNSPFMPNPIIGKILLIRTGRASMVHQKYSLTPKKHLNSSHHRMQVSRPAPHHRPTIQHTRYKNLTENRIQRTVQHLSFYQGIEIAKAFDRPIVGTSAYHSIHLKPYTDQSKLYASHSQSLQLFSTPTTAKKQIV